MKARIFALIVIAAMLFSAFGVDQARAGAYATQFTSAITYLNVGTAPTTTLRLYFYADPADTIPTTKDLPSAAVNAAGAIFIGNVGEVDPGFKGSAYLESDQMMQVTLVQIPQNSTTVKNRSLSNGFVAGGPKALIPTVLKNSNDSTTIFSIQNADSVLNNVTIKIYNLSAVVVKQFNVAIAAGAAYYVDAGTVTELGTSFSGSAIATALRADTTPGKIVGTAMELAVAGTANYSFEGFDAGALKMYMPSAMCQRYYSSSAYAVQNTASDPAQTTNVTVTYISSETGLTYTQTKAILPGAKQPFVACDVTPVGFLGSAVVESSNALAPIVAVGKVYGGGLSTSFNGVVSGAQVSGLPYVRWATTTNYASGNFQRTYLSIENVGRALLPTETITVEYWDYLGHLAGTYTYVVPDTGMPNGAKIATNPGAAKDSLGNLLLEFGMFWNGTTWIYGGAAIIKGPDGSQLAAIGRVQTIVVYPTLAVGEDYNTQPIR